MRRAQSNAAFSSNDNILPLKSDCGPSDPANHASNRSLFPPWFIQYAAPDFSDCQGGNEQIAIGLRAHPFQ
jgi:hypothetical protein